MNITQAKYYKDKLNPEEKEEDYYIQAVIDGENCTLAPSIDNYHYREIMRQVEAGELTIEPADE